MKPLRGIHIVCVDDHADTLEVLKYVLETNGAKVETAVTAAEGLELLRNEEARVVILDLLLPDADGISLMERIRQLDAFQSGVLQVIMMSAYCTETDRRNAFMAGVARFVTKPFEGEEIVAAVEEVTGRVRVHAAA